MNSSNMSNEKSKDTKLSKPSSVITISLDTKEPITTIRKLVGLRLRTNELSNHDIYMHDLPLHPNLCLYDQGVKVNGKVELSINVQTRGDGGKLTILEISQMMSEDDMNDLGMKLMPTDDKSDETKMSVSNFVNEEANTSNNNNREDEHGIPCDPNLWTAKQVYRWMGWVAKEFGLDATVVKNLGITGQELNLMTQLDFEEKIPYGNIMWSHFELLKKLYSDSSETVLQMNGGNYGLPQVINSDILKKSTPRTNEPTKIVQVMTTSSPRIMKPQRRSIAVTDKTWTGARSGNNGQIQLWQFLLELLTDADARDCISWVGDCGEFKFIQPELVAQRWGERKNKPTMNYEKLSRALRYYYECSIISKVPSKRFVYKFVCDLKQLIGYSAADLNRLVTECEKKRCKEPSNNSNYSSIDLGTSISFIPSLNR